MSVAFNVGLFLYFSFYSDYTAERELWEWRKTLNSTGLVTFTHSFWHFGLWDLFCFGGHE